MIKGDYDRLNDLAKYNVCAEHHSPVVVAWHSGEKCWTLRCGEGARGVPVRQRPGEPYQHDRLEPGHYPNILHRQLSLTQEYKAGADIPEPIKSNIEKSMRRRQMRQDNKIIAQVVEGVPNKDLATGELLLPEQVKALMDYAFKYHLDPFRGHLVLMYGKPYFTIDAYLYHAKNTRIPYTLESKPFDDAERKSYMLPEGDHAWQAKVILTDSGNFFTGLGIVTQDEMTAKSTKHPEQLRSPVVAAHPWQLAQKRAEWQALRRGFPIGESEEEPIDSKDKTPAAEVVED